MKCRWLMAQVCHKLTNLAGIGVALYLGTGVVDASESDPDDVPLTAQGERKKNH